MNERETEIEDSAGEDAGEDLTAPHREAHPVQHLEPAKSQLQRIDAQQLLRARVIHASGACGGTA